MRSVAGFPKLSACYNQKVVAINSGSDDTFTKELVRFDFEVNFLSAGLRRSLSTESLTYCMNIPFSRMQGVHL